MSEVVLHSSSVIPDIHFTEAAEGRILSYLAEQGLHALRISVKKTGCSGLSYVLDYLEAPLEGDRVISLKNDCLVCIDKESYPFIRGVVVDYVKQGLNQKFVFNNPNQTGQCGCGESFTIG